MELVVNKPMNEFPAREGYKGAGFGYASDMMHMCVNRDDAENFIKFAREVGLDAEVLIAGSLVNYAAIHGAAECVKALCDLGKNAGYPLKHWLKKAENPPYGPNARKLI